MKMKRTRQLFEHQQTINGTLGYNKRFIPAVFQRTYTSVSVFLHSQVCSEHPRDSTQPTRHCMLYRVRQ